MADTVEIHQYYLMHSLPGGEFFNSIAPNRTLIAVDVPCARAVSRGSKAASRRINEETGRSRFLFVCRQSASNYGAGSTTGSLFTAPVSVDSAMAVLLTEPALTSGALMV